jgi:hypothetical protein
VPRAGCNWLDMKSLYRRAGARGKG